jgi:hypothetical protein
MELENLDDLCISQAKLEKMVFDCTLALKRLLSSHPTLAASAPIDGKGVRWPKLDAPIFDGKFVNWRPFWDQFNVAIHGRSSLSKAEKLAYLRNSLKDGPAKGVIEGLSESGNFYDEAIDSLKARYDCPRPIHQSHVRTIIEAPALKEGTGRELRRLHDTAQQHLRALKAMAYEPSCPFITSVLELKLDSSTRFEWQKFSQDASGVPHFEKLLEFLDLRAQASEALPPDHKKNSIRDPLKRNGSKSITSFTANTSDMPGSCPNLQELEAPIVCLCSVQNTTTRAEDDCAEVTRLMHQLSTTRTLRETVQVV